MEINVSTAGQQKLIDFLEDCDYLVEQLSDNILAVKAVGGPSIYVAQENIGETASLYFELSLGPVGKLGENANLLYKLLNLNSEIAPVSVAINTECAEPTFCLVERLSADNLDSNELLAVLEGLGLACLRLQQLLD